MNEDRNQIWIDYLKQGGSNNKKVAPMFLNYNRYAEAAYIIQGLYRFHQDLEKLKILDYGCGVGDYGMFLLHAGAEAVVFYDYPRAVNFVRYRLDLEKIPLERGIALSADDVKQIDDYSEFGLVIFGEVLEHLPDPLAELKKVVDSGVKLIFTSSYPYRSEDPEDRYWSNHDHDESARLQIPDCKKLLEDNYSYQRFEGELRLWVKR